MVVVCVCVLGVGGQGALSLMEAAPSLSLGFQGQPEGQCSGSLRVKT